MNTDAEKPVPRRGRFGNIFGNMTARDMESGRGSKPSMRGKFEALFSGSSRRSTTSCTETKQAGGMRFTLRTFFHGGQSRHATNALDTTKAATKAAWDYLDPILEAPKSGESKPGGPPQPQEQIPSLPTTDDGRKGFAFAGFRGGWGVLPLPKRMDPFDPDRRDTRRRLDDEFNSVA